MQTFLTRIAMTPARSIAAWVTTMLAFAAPVLAHDPHEITADVHFVEDRLEVMLTQTHLTALAACSMDTKNRKNFSSRQFEEVKAELEKGAREAIEVKSVKGRLEPTRVAATMNKEGEIEFRFVYPRPVPGKVTLDAIMLRPLAELDYIVEATVLIDGKFRSQHALQLGASKMEITLEPK